MKTYGKKFLKGRMDDISQSRVETRDAILWAVHSAERYCDVKIQGSNILVVAHFPQSWDHIPAWLKVGNSVRIAHMGGKRVRIEVVGCGQLIPTPVASIGLSTWTDISFVATGGHILSVTTDFTALGIVATDRFVIAGSTLNNGTFTAITVGAHDLVVAETIVDETAGDPVTITLLTGTLPTPAAPIDSILTGCRVTAVPVTGSGIVALGGGAYAGGGGGESGWRSSENGDSGSGTKADPYKINKLVQGSTTIYIPQICSDDGRGRGQFSLPMGAKIYFEIDPLVTTGLSVSAFKVGIVFYEGAGSICKLTKNKGTGIYSSEVCTAYTGLIDIVLDNTPLEIDDYQFLYAIDNTLGNGSVNDSIWVVMPFVP